MPNIEFIRPADWPEPKGYANGISVSAEKMLFLGGQVAFDTEGKIVGVGDLIAQFDQTLKNLGEVCRAGDGHLTDVVKLTIFVQDRDDYRAKSRELGAVWREHFGKHYPAMTLVEVSRFYEEDVLVEIEGIAVLDGK